MSNIWRVICAAGMSGFLRVECWKWPTQVDRNRRSYRMLTCMWTLSLSCVIIWWCYIWWFLLWQAHW